jgi:hypothetical protein
MTPAVDDEIFRLPIPEERSDDQWEAIARHLTAELGARLGARLSVDDRLVVDGVALRCETSGPAADGRDPFLSYHGIIGFESIADAPHVDAAMFLYFQGRRLTPEDQPSSFLSLTYRRANPDARGAWRLDGWMLDDYGEFEGFAPARLPKAAADE